MKYGEKLRQRSIPAWSAYNIDYDDIKHFIKERTTAKDSSIAAAQSDERLRQTEDDLFAILEEQHRRIDLFVKSKAREIQHRLNDSKRRLRQLAARNHSGESGISAAKLERYSLLESDVIKAGNEIRSLARFIGAQRTGFGKLLKKNKKWTGSLQLEDKFREQILSDPKSFTKFDLGPLLDEYSATLHNIRALYANRIRQATKDDEPEAASYLIGSSIISQFNASLATKRKADFDTAIATVPLSEDGIHATYFVHPENVVELQVLLIQYMNYWMSRSRQNSLIGPVTLQDSENTDGGSTEHADYFWLGADDPERFAQEQRALKSADQEARPGSTPQRSRISARWNTDEEESDALIAARVGETHVQVSKLKKKHVEGFFDKSAAFPPRRASQALMRHADELSDIRSPYTRDESASPLYLMTSHRSRFTGLSNSARQVLVATLDTGISVKSYNKEADSRIKFPFAVLIVRQEGQASAQLFNMLDQSHLVERVQGFSMEHHAIWELCKTANVPTPSWTALLTQDIRKLPPPALKHSDTTNTSLTLGSGLDGSASTLSVLNGTGGTGGSVTAVETTGESDLFAAELEQPPLRAFRKKRRRAFPQELVVPQERYWSEYDHPEDGEDADGSYVIYIDPDEKSTFDRMMETVSSWFTRPKKGQDEESLLHSPSTPKDDESSSDEETSTRAHSRRHQNYGTVIRHSQLSLLPSLPTPRIPFLPQPTITCLIASAVILIIGYVLSATGRHRFAATVEASVVFALVASVLFVIAGVVVLARANAVQQLGLATAVTVVLVESIAAGGLLAQVVG